MAKRFLGAGASKRVYLARDTLIDRDVAFALIRIEGLDASHRQRILREARTMGRLGDHPNIVQLYDLGEEDDDHLFMVLPLMEGGTVEEVIRRSPKGRVPIAQALAIAGDVCRGLEYAHGRDVVHRDLKPSNVWLTNPTEGLEYPSSKDSGPAWGTSKIGDFGLATSIDLTRLTQTGTVVGTLQYMSPEQATGGEITARSDLFSLGCMLYEMVCGRPPFVGDDPRSIIAQVVNSDPVEPSQRNSECPEEVAALIRRLLAKDPADRPGSAAEVLAALEGDERRPRSTKSSPDNLPSRLTSFIGREEEKGLLGATRLLTLTGAGGCGKSRLALQVASELLEDFPDGVWLVELAAIADPSLVTQEVAAVVGVEEEPDEELSTTLLKYLASRNTLVVLDNCEHLVQACAEVADRLLTGAPQLKILATSREPLGIAGETTWRVPSLSMPDVENLPELEALTQYEAVRLFIERAVALESRFEVTNENAPAVAHVCHRLDGIPLAIELAAVRVKVLSAEQINERIEDRFRLLTGGSRSALPRQQTLRALVDWSYDLLDEAEQALFARLSVFAGGFMLDSAEAVCADGEADSYEVLDLLSSLVDKSMVIWDGGASRYRMLETLREYARERLVEGGLLEVLENRHATHFLAIAEEAEPELEQGPKQHECLDRLENEHDNLRAALRWVVESAETETALRLGKALEGFWSIRGHLSEGREWLAQVLALPGAPIDPRHGKALSAAGTLASVQGDLDAAESHYQRSLSSLRQADDRRAVAKTLVGLADVAESRGDYGKARSLLEKSLEVSRGLGEQTGIAESLGFLARIAETQGLEDEAQSHYQLGLEIAKELGDKQGIGSWQRRLARSARSRGDYAAARALYEESLTVFRELGDSLGVAKALIGLVVQHPSIEGF